jgi:hypothetical protein
MRVENVLFIDSEVKNMKRKDFIDKMKEVHYLDRPIIERETLLGDIYDRIKGKENPVIQDGL